MSLYNEADRKMFMEKGPAIIEKADEISMDTIEPTKDRRWEMIYIVRDFVIKNKRKVYGGFALNKLIEQVAPQDKFYDDTNVKDWDIDFYSPDPINDAKEIANKLKEKGFHYIQAREAQHDETYKVFADTADCADITYVPRNIYNKIPYKEINGLYITGPHFMMIDYFRMLTDPLTSYFRLEKSFERLCLMLKYYPLPHNTSSIDIVPPDRDLDVAFHTVHEFLINRESTIVVGMYAYDHLIKESGIADKNLARNNFPDKRDRNIDRKSTKDAVINYVDINYYEIISTKYKQDARELILKLQDKFSHSKNKITFQENYPFFQYLGFSVNIYFDGEIICRMYHYNSRCIPYNDVPALYFKKNSYDEYKGKIRIGTFAMIMLYNLINIMKARTDNDQNTKNLYYTLISHMIEMKNYYFARTHKTIFDKSLFQEFILRCTGKMFTPQMEKAIRMEKRKEMGKKYSWSYNPENEKDRENNTVYRFHNSSGNPINNVKNLKIDLTHGISHIGNDNDDLNIYDDNDNDDSIE